VSRLVVEHCDQKVSLPLAGHIDSLNASVAAGIMMYRVLSSRKA
jgi:23S rRNA (guanosine2251-2'-O)-methyltransferase